MTDPHDTDDPTPNDDGPERQTTDPDGRDPDADTDPAPDRPRPGVPDLGREEGPAAFVPDDVDDPDPEPGDGPGDSAPTTADGGDSARTDGGSPAEGAEAPTGGGSPTAGADLDPSTYEPVDVFEGGDLDLRAGTDSCYKCTSCDTSCPVAEVDDEFPGPKFQGPEQWRLKRKDDVEIDESITSCSNCMRCDSACPSGVPLSQMHNEARGEYVEEQMSKLSREYVRNRVLSNYRFFATVASKTPRIANFVAGLGVSRWLGEKVLGVTSEREFPDFATETFREWWRKRGGSQVADPKGTVAYFHGCYSNFNTPEVAKAMVRVYEHFDYEVLVPPQKCSGTPMFANGMLPDARRHAETNVEELAAAIADGADVIASCTSCSLSLRQEYPELFDIEGVEDVAANTFEALEYLRIHEDLSGELAEAELDGRSLAYHAPCHARNQGLARQARELFRDVDGLEVEDVGDSCSGISGTYGWKAEKYEYSMEIGEEMFEHMESAEGEVGLTECPTCAMQMEHGTGYEIRHPLEVLEDALLA